MDVLFKCKEVKCGIDIFCTKSFYLFIVSCKTILHYCIVVGAVEVKWLIYHTLTTMYPHQSHAAVRMISEIKEGIMFNVGRD